MDSMDLEREKGITILAKNTAVRYGEVKINIIDTPGHADFGGEVERGLTMVDGVLLLVDASEGPLPQTRFVLRKALEARLPVILVVNKVDRPDARIGEVVDEVYELFLDLDADEDADRVPDRLHQRARPAGRRWTEGARRHATSAADGPAARAHPGAAATTPSTPSRRSSPTSTPPPTSAASRSAACATATSAAASRSPGAGRRRRSSARRSASSTSPRRSTASTPQEAGPGEIIAVAGIAEVTIGETLADVDDPRPLPVITVDEPSLSVTIGINTSPLAGAQRQQADRATGRGRLDQELVGNVAIRVRDTDRPDSWEVQGRGELALAVLVEMMRREGFELTVGQPQVRHARDRRSRARAGRARRDRRARGLRRRRHPAAGAAQGAPRADGQPRHRLGADGVPGAGARPDRLPHRVPDRDARNRPSPPRLRPLGAMGRRASHAPDRRARRRPRRRSPRSSR